MENRIDKNLILDTLKIKLKKIGYDFDLLIRKEQNYLLLIEEEITNIFELEKYAREIVAKNKVSIKGISNKTNISRQTLYNNDILRIYIESREEEFNKVDFSKLEEKKKREIEQLKNEINILHERDVELQELKRENDKLKKTLKEKDELIKLMKKSADKDSRFIN